MCEHDLILVEQTETVPSSATLGDGYQKSLRFVLRPVSAHIRLAHFINIFRRASTPSYLDSCHY